MKKIQDMTTEEIFELNSDDIDNQIDLQCAINGVPLLPPHPGSKPEKPVITKKDYYTVDEKYYFETRNEAMNLLTLLTKGDTMLVDEGWGEDKRMITIDSDSYSWPKISTKSMMTQDVYEASKPIIKKYQKELQQWEEINNAYKEAKKGRDEIAEEVYEQRTVAIDKVNRFIELEGKFERYIKLAGGDKVVAMGFLIDAENIDSEIVDRLMPEYNALEDTQVINISENS